MLRFRTTRSLPKKRGLLAVVSSKPKPHPPVRRQLSPQSGRALEMLGHAIEYLADEYAADLQDKGPLGNADPRIEAIQILKGLNRAIYFSGSESQPAFRRLRDWLKASRIADSPAKRA